ncbi:tyrosine-protein phosphatase [Petrimonas sulfuriphila]|uniref:tyrosine-protein phosphatase n=1 Tax=Petrimonas sulfuriphila TaxID=285070 RepID=UPI00324AE554
MAEKNKDGDLLLKWEVSPDQEGNINIYSSQSDSDISAFTPIKTSNITDQVTVINPSSPDIREFYILKTTSAYSGIIANRIIEMSNIKNFRDMGGYFTRTDQQMKWGKIFRSGDLSSATLYDQERIRRLNIRTIIDFRSDRTAKRYPILVHPNIRKISLPITPLDDEKINEMMDDEHLTRSDAIRDVQDSYIGIIENYKNEFAEMFNILTDENNYPVLLSGSLGKDRVGLASFFILYAVGIPQNVIIDDYLLSRQTVDISKIAENVKTKPEYFQEAVTALMSVNPAYINYTIDYINQKYGSIDNYLEKELKLTSGKKILLRKYLLYNQ